MCDTITKQQLAQKLNITETELKNLETVCELSLQEDSLAAEQVGALLVALIQNEDAGRRGLENLRYLSGRYHIFIDTCSLLHQSFWLLAERLLPMLAEAGAKLYVPGSVVRELSGLRIKPDVSPKLPALIKGLQEWQKAGLVYVFGDAGYGDDDFVRLAVQNHRDAELLIITQDYKLSQRILDTVNSDTVGGYPVAISRINRFGFLSRYNAQQPSAAPALTPNGTSILPHRMDCSYADKLLQNSGMQ